MKFLVDSLPYYNDDCFFCSQCGSVDGLDCPRTWTKGFICSDENPHECEMLKEVDYGKV